MRARERGVGPGGGDDAVPGRAVRVGCLDHRRERLVARAPQLRGGRVAHGGARERVREHELAPGRRSRRPATASRGRGGRTARWSSPSSSAATSRARGVGVGRQAERLLQRGRQRRPGAEQRPVVGARVGQRELAQRERVARRPRAGSARARAAAGPSASSSAASAPSGPTRSSSTPGRAGGVAREEHGRAAWAAAPSAARVCGSIHCQSSTSIGVSSGQQRRGYVGRVGHDLRDRLQRRQAFSAIVRRSGRRS